MSPFEPPLLCAPNPHWPNGRARHASVFLPDVASIPHGGGTAMPRLALVPPIAKRWDLFPVLRGTLLEFELRRAVAEQGALEFENYYEPWDSWFHARGWPTKYGGPSVFF